MPIRWTQPAADDLTHISDYTQEHFGPAQARRAALAIYEAADSLGKLPRRGRPGRKPNTRELAIPGLPFLIVYRLGRCHRDRPHSAWLATVALVGIPRAISSPICTLSAASCIH